MVLFGIILVAVTVSAIITHQKIEKASQQENLAANIAQGASELSYLSNDYLIYRESQQLSRWQSRFASFSSQVASLNVDRPEQQALVSNIQANQQRLNQVFDNVVSAAENSSLNQQVVLDPAFLQVSWSRIAVQCQGLISDASRLSQLLHQQMDQLTNTRTMLIYLMVGLFGAFLLASYMLTYRRILKSIETLRARTAIIGSGNLDFIIEEKENDEIGDLSRAFNRMTTDLKAVTASKEDLEREVTQRKRAEEDLRRQREWLRVTLSSIGDAVIASDTEGRITFLNPVAATLTGWQLEETPGQPIQDVFRIINEKTHAPAEDLVARVLNEKRVVGLANDTALVTKDGREVPIEDSAAPIQDSAGNLIGVVLVFHDVTEKRRAQATLREALGRAVWLARFPDENPNPVLRVSADGTTLYCNPASMEVHGWACRVGEPLPDPLLLLLGQAMPEGKEATQDMELEGRSYSVSVTPFPGEGYANMYARDITEGKRAEERNLRHNMVQEGISRIFQEALSSRTDEELGRTCLSVAEEVTESKFGFIDEIGPDGYLHDLAISDPGWELCTMYDKMGHRRPPGTLLIHGIYGRVVADAKSLIVNDPSSHPDRIGVSEGHPPLTAFLGVPLIRDGKTIGMIAVGNREGGYRTEDQEALEGLVPAIVESFGRKRAEEALRESEARLNRSQEIAHLGSWELELVNNRLNWSDEVYRIFGLQPQEFGATYEAFLEAVHPDDRTAVDAAYSGSVREGRDTYEIEHRVVRKSTGEIRTVHERCAHIRDASRRIIRSVGMIHDITERKRAEETLRQRTFELQRLTETLEQRVQERTAELTRTSETLRHLSSKLLSTQEEERKRIAGEIHDTLGSCLSGIKFKVENVLQHLGKTTNVGTESLSTILPVIQEGIEECRRIQMDLRPSLLDDLGLLATLSWFCRRYQTIYTGIKVELEQTLEEREIPSPLKIVIFRVTQEGMNNIAKHSKADLVHLSLWKMNGRIELVLQDNGQGFDLKKVIGSESTKRGLGLTSMRERTELSGGSFAIESVEGQGTTVRASWLLGENV